MWVQGAVEGRAGLVRALAGLVESEEVARVPRSVALLRCGVEQNLLKGSLKAVLLLRIRGRLELCLNGLVGWPRDVAPLGLPLLPLVLLQLFHEFALRL